MIECLSDFFYINIIVFDFLQKQNRRNGTENCYETLIIQSNNLHCLKRWKHFTAIQVKITRPIIWKIFHKIIPISFCLKNIVRFLGKQLYFVNTRFFTCFTDCHTSNYTLVKIFTISWLYKKKQNRIRTKLLFYNLFISIVFGF